MSIKNEYFPALMKYWRGQRGISQLDLSALTNVSSRHISFLETGRSAPSVEMVLLIADALDVPLRSRNEMLRAANFEPRYPDPDLNEALNKHLSFALDAMLRHHEPYPMIVFDRTYNYFRGNLAGEKFATVLAGDEPEKNLLKLMFREQTRAIIENWDEFASEALRRVQRELLYNANDEELRQLLEELLAVPHVPENWRELHLDDFSEPLATVNMNIFGHKLSFAMAVTKFDAPQNISINELTIESWFPRDEETRSFCAEHLAPPKPESLAIQNSRATRAVRLGRF